jgi:hypothetical protein
MVSPLENLSGLGKSLQKEPPDTKEFAGLKRSGFIAACRAVADKIDTLPSPESVPPESAA